MTSPRLLVVARLRKPHGLKGEVTVFPLTDAPEATFQPGRELTMLDLAGTPVGQVVTIERSRPFHREWLLKFRGLDERNPLESMRDLLLAAPAETLAPLAEGEVYVHELEGFALRDPAGLPLGVVTGVLEMPSGLMLEVQGPKREFLVPYRKEFVRQVDREGRSLVVALPEGLTEL